uniref:Uncharacterized protein n=1 Tax=Magallana gigas TaxID=29159 RepID=A0A8W8IL29_MAGGI
MENIQDIFIHLTNYPFSLIKVYRNENKFLTAIYNWKMFTSFLYSEVLGTPRAIFQCYHLGLLMADAMQNPLRLSILGCVLKPEAIEGMFQNR